MASITWCTSSGSSWAGFFDGGDLSEVDRLPCARGIVYGLLIIVNGTGGFGVTLTGGPGGTQTQTADKTQTAVTSGSADSHSQTLESRLKSRGTADLIFYIHRSSYNAARTISTRHAPSTRQNSNAIAEHNSAAQWMESEF